MSCLRDLARFGAGVVLFAVAIWIGGWGASLLVAYAAGLGDVIPGGISWPVAILALLVGLLAYRQARQLLRDTRDILRAVAGVLLLMLALWLAGIGAGVMVTGLMDSGGGVPVISWSVGVVAIMTGFLAYRRARHLLLSRAVTAPPPVVAPDGA